jgi:hypothetical protein
VIAVDVGADGAKFMQQPRTALGVLTQVFVAVERVVSQQQAPTADFIIIPRVGHIRWDQSRRADELVKIGYETTIAAIDQIKNLIERRSLALNSAA